MSPPTLELLKNSSCCYRSSWGKKFAKKVKYCCINSEKCCWQSRQFKIILRQKDCLPSSIIAKVMKNILLYFIYRPPTLMNTPEASHSTVYNCCCCQTPSFLISSLIDTDTDLISPHHGYQVSLDSFSLFCSNLRLWTTTKYPTTT